MHYIVEYKDLWHIDFRASVSHIIAGGLGNCNVGPDAASLPE